MRFSTFLLLLVWATPAQANALADENCSPETETSSAKELQKNSAAVLQALLGSPDVVFSTLPAAIDAKTATQKPVKYISIGNSKFSRFPSYSECAQSFFRVATISKAIDALIVKDGWKSGWARREDELKSQNIVPEDKMFDALPPQRSIEDRIIQYVRVKNIPSEFPKHAALVGVLVDPIRTLSVGYHTGFNNGIRGDHMRLDEIEVGACAKAPECKNITAVDSSAVFKKRKLIPRYSTEGEWAVDKQIPSACIVATYRIKFQKIDDKCYSDVNKNCNF